MTDAGSESTMSLAFVEGLYADYLKDPASVPEDWRLYFAQSGGAEPFSKAPQIGPSFKPRSLFNSSPGGARPILLSPATQETHGNGAAAGISNALVLQDRVDALVRAYRVRGHMIAAIDPLGLPRGQQPELDPSFYDLKPEDMDRQFSSRTIFGAQSLSLRDIIHRLSSTYCRSIGVQFMHIDDLQVKNWLQERMEGSLNRVKLSREEQLRILSKLTDASIFEEFIQKKFIGAKSFSLEGSESLVPLLSFAIERAALHGVNEIVLGMAHRGRLNVLANIMGKSPRAIFREFADVDPELYFGSGDVKYHLGHSSDYISAAGKRVHLSLCFNPSHLEYVNTVVLGRCRAKQDRIGDKTRSRKCSILIHGDAAFAGEGIIQETLNLSQLDAYATGGTIHVIVNNQIGFTTPPSEGRSTTYATDVAKMLQIPIFHVNGEDPEAVAQVVLLAMDFKRTFSRDVVIDMYGYRRLGHNESDEPAFTQPLLYNAIAKRKSVRDGYLEHLLALGEVTREEADQIAIERRDHLDAELSEARHPNYVRVQDWLGGVWQGYIGGPESGAPDVPTTVDKATLTTLMEALTKVPDDFTPHKKLQRILAQRAEMGRGERPFDWGTAELLAFATLLKEKVRVRFTGQDVGRGTFSQRHAVLHDVETGRKFLPLSRVAPDQGPIDIYNSPLSEAGVLGFEYGYSLDWPEALVIWEAQFGDFMNAAQVIIDQFISSAEDKWKRLSGLVLLLPHGFEGQGPEHSSARIERFLALAAEDNIQVAQPSTPANHFHLLRRQVLRPWRKPLIVFTPKSLLRLPEASSSLAELSEGGFQRVILDSREAPAHTTKVLLCSGKVYYELENQRKERKRDDIAIVRLEQLYPLHESTLRPVIEAYAPGTPLVWVQDEPENMGPWRFLRNLLSDRVYGSYPLSVVCRPASASPATGSAKSHKLEEQRLMDAAFS
jgi:2-oxoglutarate dehydrogenase E1 component